MADFSGGTVTYGDLILNADRVKEAEPVELNKTIHNQLMALTGKYGATTADYDGVFGPYSPDYPHTGAISIEESPGGEHCPEIHADEGYVLVGGSCPTVRLPGGVRTHSSGTQFAACVTPGANSGDAVIYLVFVKKSGGNNIEIVYPGATAELEHVGFYVQIKVFAGAVVELAQEADIASSGDQFVIDFYDWACKMVSRANLRG